MTILSFHFFDADALLQESGRISISIAPGEQDSFTWLLQSDDDKPITVKISSEGLGSEYLSFPQSIQIEPKQIVQIPIGIMIPLDYTGQLIMSPTLVATKLGDTHEATVINLQLAKTVEISINENTNVNSEELTTKTKADQVTGYVNIEQKNDAEIKGGGCLIATAAYGTELAPQVQLLREIRDTALFGTSSGITFMDGFNKFYYSFSPTVADWERQSPILKEIIRISITPMISTLFIITLAEDGQESHVITLGITAILLNVGMYLIVPAVIIKKLTKKSDRYHYFP